MPASEIGIKEYLIMLCTKYDVKIHQLTSRSRTRELSDWRMLFCESLYVHLVQVVEVEKMDLYRTLGLEFNRSLEDVRHMIRTTQNLRKTYPEWESKHIGASNFLRHIDKYFINN